MLEAIRNRMRDRDEGFTLIELMVVVLIIAILVAIAIPTFLGARERAQQKAAQSSARNGVTAAKVLFTDSSAYSTSAVTQTALNGVEPSLTFLAAAGDDSTDDKVVSWTVSDSLGSDSINEFYAAVKSDSGECYYIRDNPAEVSGSNGTMFAEGASTATCDATAALTATGYSANGW